MKKLLICLISASLILCSGCAEKGSSASENSAKESSDVSSTVAEGNGFDFDSAIKDITICGNKVSLPCTFRELGNGFRYDSPIESEEQNYMFTTLRYGETDIGVIYLELSSSGNYDDSKIISLVLNSHSDSTIKGVGTASSEKDIIAALGDDFVKNDLTIDYGSEEEGLVRILMNSVTNTPSSITIMLPRE